MHLVLRLPELLYNIFGHLAPKEDWEWVYERLPNTSDLAALARTCRTFKEPALDILWSELPELSALARCVPDATYVPDATHSRRSFRYAFKRPLTEAEWVTIRSYARRVWIFLNYTLMELCLEEESVATLFNYTGGTLFPNLRFLCWYSGRPFPLQHVAAKSLRILYLDFQRADVLHEYRNVLESAGSVYPLVKSFRLIMPRQIAELDDVISGHVLRWSNLRYLNCREVALHADAILHISRMSALTHLTFILKAEVSSQILLSDTALVFSNLISCEIVCGWLFPVVDLLVRTRLPVIKELIVRFPGSPSQQTIRSFMTTLRNVCSADTLTHINVQSQRYLMRRLCSCGGVGSEDYSFAYDDLYPCMTFGNLRSLKINLEQPVRLTDDQLVELASAWPCIEELFINYDSGWHVPSGGISLDGLLRLFRTCPLLRGFSLLLDTPTFMHIPEGTDVSYPLREFDQINLIDSPLEPEMFAGVVDAFVAIEFSPRMLFSWVRTEMEAVLFASETRQSWRDVDEEVKARLAAGH